MVAKIIQKETIKQGAAALLLTAVAVALLRWPQAAATGISRGLAVCGEVIIPSLFPFLVVTGMVIRLGIAARLGRRSEKLARRLFGVSGYGCTVWIISAIGGYPAGAAAVRDLLDRQEIAQEEAAHLLLFCVNGGPAFLIGTVGARLMGNVYKGVWLYIAHLAASLLIGILCRRGTGSTTQVNIPSAKYPLTVCFAQAVERACQSVLTMSGFVLLFSSLLTLSQVSGLTEAITSVMFLPFTEKNIGSAIYTSFWEVSSGCVELCSVGFNGIPLWFLIGAAIGFGGISVSSQIRGMLSEYKVIGRSYWIARGWHALFGGVLSALCFAFIPMPSGKTQMVLAPLNRVSTIQLFSVSSVASVSLLLLCGTFLWWRAKE